MRFRHSIIIMILGAFLSQGVFLSSYAQGLTDLPVPGRMLASSSVFQPILMQGLRVHKENPFKLDFMLETGDAAVNVNSAIFRDESIKLIKYFLALLTIPDKEIWVNLSPYEKDRIIGNGLGRTAMGRDLLAQDYILKQLTASLTFPEEGVGKAFWDRIYRDAQVKFGTTDIPVDAFNKVWIMPDRAEVFEKDGSVYVTDAHLKVMLETDYMAAGAVADSTKAQDKMRYDRDASNSIFREVIIPAIEKEVNEGRNFDTLRQIYHAQILAVWYKVKLENGILAQVYVDRNKTMGIHAKDKFFPQKIYARYLDAFRKGVYNYVKEESAGVGREHSAEMISKKYFSGGVLGLNRSGLRIRKGEAPISFIKGIVGTRVLVTSTLQGVRRSSLNADATDDAMENHEKLMAALLEARRAMMDGRWEDAWQGYERTLHYDGRNTEALCGLGEVGFRQKKFEDGRVYFQQAIDIDSRNTQALNGLGRFYLWEQKFEMARTKFNAILAIDPDNLEAWSGLADTYGALDGLSVQDYRDIVKGILTHFSFHDIYKLRFGNVPFEFWLKDEARRTGTRFRVKGIAGLTVMLNTIFSGGTSEQSLRMFLDEYVASDIVQNYLQHTMNLVLSKPSLNRVKADLYHMARDFREPEGYLKRLQIYLNGLENVFEETQATLPERIKNAGVTWHPGILPNDFKNKKRYKILQTQSVRKFMASFSAPDDRDKMEGNEFIKFEDAKSGLVIWGNRISSFPTTYLYNNSDLRSIVLGNRWREQEGHIGQVLIGFRRAGVKVPVAMVQAAGDGEAVFIFMSPEDVSAILASVVHTDSRVFSTVDFIRQEMSLPAPDPELVPAAMSLIDREAEQLNGMLSLMVNVRGASGSIIAQTDEYYFIQSARHVVTGPGQFLDNETINVSFYAEEFNNVYPAEVVNRGVFFEGGASAGFSDDTLILRIARNSISENVRRKIGRPILANLRQGPPRVWSPYQAVAFIALSGTGGAKTPVISYGYTTVVPPGSLDDADRTVNIPVMVRSELGFSGGPLVTMFSGNMAIVGSRTCPGWSSQIRLGYFTPILKYVEELIHLTGISSSSRDQAMISDADAPEELPLNDALRLSHQPAYTIPPFVSRQALGLMPSAVDKWELRDGKINIVYNPDHVDPRYFPTAL